MSSFQSKAISSVKFWSYCSITRKINFYKRTSLCGATCFSFMMQKSALNNSSIKTRLNFKLQRVGKANSSSFWGFASSRSIFSLPEKKYMCVCISSLRTHEKQLQLFCADPSSCNLYTVCIDNTVTVLGRMCSIMQDRINLYQSNSILFCWILYTVLKYSCVKEHTVTPRQSGAPH